MLAAGRKMKGESLGDRGMQCKAEDSGDGISAGHVSRRGSSSVKRGGRIEATAASSAGLKHLLWPGPGLLMKGQSLQAIHAQSSTETSGLGDTITSGVSSQESLHSCRGGAGKDANSSVRGDQLDTFNCSQSPQRDGSEYKNYTTFAPPPVVYIQVSDRTWRPISTHPDSNVHPRGFGKRVRRRPSFETAVEMAGINSNSESGRPAAARASNEDRYTQDRTNFDELFIASSNTDNNRVHDYTRAPNYRTGSTAKPMTSVPGYGLSSSGGHGYTTNSPSVGLQPDQEDSWSRRNSVRSISSLGGGSFRSRSGSTRGSRKFLGRTTESRWLRWSKDRRLSYRRKLDMMEKDNQEEDRIPTPVKKARKECLKFVHPDLEHKYLSEEDLKDHHRQQQVQQQYYYGMLDAKNGDGLHLTIIEWHLLADYWDHKVFNRARYVAVFLSFLGLLLTIIALTHYNWMTYLATTDKGNVTQGLWMDCYTDPIMQEDVCESFSTNWQNAVIGFMLFAASFGFLASILSILGVCTTPLPKKIYYFHSSGEIFLVCAASCTFALLIYPMSIELDKSIEGHRYGIGYGLGWGAAFFFYAAALCMSLDELVRASSRAKCCRCCWGRSNEGDRGDLRQV